MLRTPKSYGYVKFLFLWIIFIAFIAFSFSVFIERSYQPKLEIDNNQGRASITIKKNRSGMYRASGFINDYPVVFLIDTGANSVAIPGALANKMNLRKTSKITLSTAAGFVDGYTTTIKSLSLGNFLFEDIDGIISPYMDESTVLLGMNVLDKVHIIQQNGYLTLQSNP